jgi:hypothetical protein
LDALRFRSGGNPLHAALVGGLSALGAGTTSASATRKKDIASETASEGPKPATPAAPTVTPTGTTKTPYVDPFKKP